MGNLKQGETVYIIKEEFNWYNIILPKRFIPFVYAKYLKKINQTQAIVNASILNLRSKPSLYAPIIGKIKRGKAITIVSKRGKWMAINGYPYTSGWVHSKFIDIITKSTSKKNIVTQNNHINISKNNIPIGKHFSIDRPIKAGGFLKSKQSNAFYIHKLFKVRGDLYTIGQLQNCPANYRLKSASLTFFLKIGNIKNLAKLVNSKVTIEGERIYDKCAYIKVKKIY